MKEYSYVFKVAIPEDVWRDEFCNSYDETKLLDYLNNCEQFYGVSFELEKTNLTGEDFKILEFVLKAYVPKYFASKPVDDEFAKDGFQILAAIRFWEEEGIAYGMKLLKVEGK